MSEYINKLQVTEKLKELAELNSACGYELTTLNLRLTANMIERITAADVAPVVHGEWLNIDGDYTFAACSICETAYEVATEEEAEKGLWDAFMCSYRYCPSCGAKMDRRNET